MSDMNGITEQEAALQVLKTVVPCNVRSKQREKASFRYCAYLSTSGFFVPTRNVWGHISVSVL